MDVTLIWTIVGAAVTVIGTGIGLVSFNYTFLRNFKEDVRRQVEKNEQKTEQLDARMFQVLTGKKLEDAILEEKKKENGK
jgi:hypothetical protein